MEMKLFTAAFVAAPLLLSGCGAGSGEVTDNGDRLEYAAKVNEVQVVPLQRQDFQMQLLSNGKLAAARRSSPRFNQSGTILDVKVGNGSRVAAGQVIAELENSEQKDALESARLDMDKATLDLQDALIGLGYPLAEQDNVPEDVLRRASIRSGYSAAKLNLQKAERNLEGTVIRAPFSGRVADISLKAWDNTGSDPFCTVIDDSVFEVNFNVLESEYQFIENGQKVRVTPFGGGSPVFSGRIVTINPTIDKNGQISVCARLEGASSLLDGMNVKVTVERTLAEQFVVPRNSVVIRDGMEVLFRYNENGTSDWVYVHTLKENSESYAIEANSDRGATLSEGDLIIYSGNLNLADGSHVSIKE